MAYHGGIEEKLKTESGRQQWHKQRGEKRKEKISAKERNIWRNENNLGEIAAAMK